MVQGGECWRRCYWKDNWLEEMELEGYGWRGSKDRVGGI